jgi:hypothetical protein
LKNSKKVTQTAPVVQDTDLLASRGSRGRLPASQVARDSFSKGPSLWQQPSLTDGSAVPVASMPTHPPIVIAQPQTRTWLGGVQLCRTLRGENSVCGYLFGDDLELRQPCRAKAG